MRLTELPPERDVRPVDLRGEEELVLGLLPALLLHVALAQVLVHVVAERLLDLFTALPRLEHHGLGDLLETLPRRCDQL